MVQQLISQALPLLVQVIVLVVGVLGSVALHKAQSYLSKLKQGSQTSLIANLAYSVVNLTEAQMKDGKGADKFDFALSKLSEILASKKINVTEAELQASIETAVAHLPQPIQAEVAPVIETKPEAAPTLVANGVTQVSVEATAATQPAQN